MELNRTGYFRHARRTLGRLPVRRARNVSGGVTRKGRLMRVRVAIIASSN